MRWRGQHQSSHLRQEALPQAPDETNKKNVEGLIQQWSTTSAKVN
jgi:hypothetical protein